MTFAEYLKIRDWRIVNGQLFDNNNPKEPSNVERDNVIANYNYHYGQREITTPVTTGNNNGLLIIACLAVGFWLLVKDK